MKIKSICQAVLNLLSGNQIQDGCPSRHIGYRIALNIERNLPLPSPNTHTAKMDLIGQGVLLEIDGNQKLTDGRTPGRPDNAYDDNTP